MDGTLMIANDGKTIGIRFGMQAIMAISAEGILDNEAKGNSEKAFFQTSAIINMAYHGYLNWCLWMDSKPEMDKRAFIEFFDNASISNMNLYSDVVKAFEVSETMKKLKDGQKKMKSAKK